MNLISGKVALETWGIIENIDLLKEENDMREMKMIDLETAKGMTKGRLTVELGKCVNYLRKELGMNREDAVIFISSVSNLGVAIQECFDQEKSK